jgi:hypothetical protein
VAVANISFFYEGVKIAEGDNSLIGSNDGHGIWIAPLTNDEIRTLLDMLSDQNAREFSVRLEAQDLEFFKVAFQKHDFVSRDEELETCERRAAATEVEGPSAAKQSAKPPRRHRTPYFKRRQKWHRMQS